MYLKTIEVQGFKSFANKIVFEFHNGITAIVGPNGSGKSNVADAVRWVLGEQRIKQLRGSSMQDVIFSGTETRKPQGFAYVAITLDNSDHTLDIDYDEVTVSRRLYRSGESEYMINGSSCRLKDVQELFYDTGIGKEGYSIIGQGQIDQILSNKPEDRRELFDEAAGIVKYKRRKAITQKKLDDEKQNMVRVTDILSELEKQVGPLKEQSDTAREYLRLKDELKACEVNLFLTESGNVNEQLIKTEEKIKVVSDELDTARAEAEKVKDDYDEFGRSLDEIDRSIEEERNLKNQADLLKESLDGRINVLREQINTELSNEENIRSRIVSIDSEVEEKQGQVKQYLEENGSLKETMDSCDAQRDAVYEKVRLKDEEIAELDGKVENEKSGMILALNEKADLSARQQRFETMLEQIEVRSSEVAQRLLRSKSDESAQEELKKAEEARLASAEEKISKLDEERKECEAEISGLSDEDISLSQQLDDLRKTYQADLTKLESMRNLMERYEGFGLSIRKVMESKDRVRGIHGVVADLISVKPEYETAIETALGGNIQNIVTDNESTAKRLIEYLKKNRFGRATFLPLTSAGRKNSVFNRPEVLKEQGVIGLASSLVSADSQYDGLVGYLLGRIVVVDNIDNAIALARKYQYSLRIVTLEGELLNAGGSMTGGTFKNNSNLLGRKREADELEKSCDESKSRIDSLEADLSYVREKLNSGRSELERIKEDQHSAVLEQNTISLGLGQINDRIKEITDSYADLSLENDQLKEQIDDIEHNKQELLDEVKALESRNDEINVNIDTFSAELEKARSEREVLSEELSKVSLAAANSEQKYQFVMENVARINEEIKKLNDEKEERLLGSGDIGRNIEDKNNEILKLQEDIKAASSSIEEHEASLAMKQEERDKALSSQRGLFEKREELADRVNRLDKDLMRLQNQKDKLDERLGQQTSYMWTEYGLTLSSAESLRDPEIGSVSDMRKMTETLKGQIKDLGNVNVNAIEDYKEVSQRCEFMQTQYQDLVEAQDNLVKVIDELDTGMRRQFDEEFKKIQTEFDKVFRELFGGGHGTLKLVEDEDILDAGIQIIAQPPGKKLQNMMQLSGGERALTAISLLFAIQNMKPSPFCLLDEIEAALDESNVDRFTSYLRKLTKRTQFIIITHRRGTMTAADRLYGITMQEKGVSTLVSVNLIEDSLT